MTVEELLSKVSSLELAEWMAFYRIEPWDTFRDDWHFGMLASVMANAWRGKGSKRFKPKDFIPKFHKRRQGWQEQLTIVRQITEFCRE